MKVGDKFLCKKDWISVMFNKEDRFLTKGDTYKVKLMTVYDNYDMVLFTGDSGFGEWFTYDIKNDEWYLWDFFYTQKEIRKMKLKKINKI